MKRLASIAFVAAAAVLVVLLVFMYPQAAHSPRFAERENIPGVRNFARLAPGVWRGRAPDEQGLDTLRNMGVKTIIDFRTNSEHEGLEDDLTIEYVQMPFSATEPPPPELVEEFLAIVTDPASQPVFFHCRHGKDRTGAMAALFRIRIQGWDPEKAVQEMKYFGFRATFRDLLKFVRAQEPAKKRD